MDADANDHRLLPIVRELRIFQFGRYSHEKMLTRTEVDGVKTTRVNLTVKSFHRVTRGILEGDEIENIRGGEERVIEVFFDSAGEDWLENKVFRISRCVSFRMFRRIPEERGLLITRVIPAMSIPRRPRTDLFEVAEDVHDDGAADRMAEQEDSADEDNGIEEQEEAVGEEQEDDIEEDQEDDIEEEQEEDVGDEQEEAVGEEEEDDIDEEQEEDVGDEQEEDVDQPPPLAAGLLPVHRPYIRFNCLVYPQMVDIRIMANADSVENLLPQRAHTQLPLPVTVNREEGTLGGNFHINLHPEQQR